MRKSMHQSRLRRMLTDHFDRASCNVLSEGKGEKAASRRSSVYYSRTMFLYPCHDGGRRKRRGERGGPPLFCYLWLHYRKRREDGKCVRDAACGN